MKRSIAKFLFALGLASVAVTTLAGVPPTEVETGIVVIRIAPDSSLLVPDKSRTWSDPDTRLAGNHTPQQVARLLKQTTEAERGVVIYTNRILTVAGRQVDTAQAPSSPADQRKSEPLGLWFIPSVEGDAVRLRAGLHATGDFKLSPLISHSNSVVFVTRDNNQVSPAYYVAILTPTILKP
jgi:hypothetical protein